jgi:hypothetical protein
MTCLMRAPNRIVIFISISLIAGLLFLFYAFSPAYTLPATTKVQKDSLIGLHRYCLEMKATVRKALADPVLKGNPIDSAVFNIYADSNRLVATYYSMRHGDCRFRLPLNRKLVMVISKKGYVSKIVELNSIVPPEKKTVYVFIFDIDLFENIRGMDMHVLQKPVARVKFNRDKDNFEYDADYTNSVNASLKALYKTYSEKLKAESTPPK